MTSERPQYTLIENFEFYSIIFRNQLILTARLFFAVKSNFIEEMLMIFPLQVNLLIEIQCSKFNFVFIRWNEFDACICRHRVQKGNNSLVYYVVILTSTQIQKNKLFNFQSSITLYVFMSEAGIAFYWFWMLNVVKFFMKERISCIKGEKTTAVVLWNTTWEKLFYIWDIEGWIET